MKARQFLKNTVILAVGAVVLRLIGIGFSGWLTRKIGSTGMGLFQLVFTIYNFASTLATSGIYLAVTRLVAEELGKGKYGRAAAAMRVSMVFGAVVSAGAAAFLWFGAPYIGVHILQDGRTVRSLRVLAAALPFMAFSCSLRGYFFAIREVWKTNTSQILEQLVRIAVVALAFQIVLPKGLEWACVGIALGSVGGEAVAFCYTLTLYLRDKHKRTFVKEKSAVMARPVLAIAGPVALSGYLKAALSSVENILVPRGLRRYGADTATALAQYGMMEAMVIPVLNFPAALIASFSNLLVPEVAEWRATGKTGEIAKLTGRVLRVTLLFALPVSAAFICFGEELGGAIYGNPEAGKMLWIMAPLTPILYLDTVADALLKGMDQQVAVMRYSIIDSGLSVLLLYTLLPLFGVKGYITVLFFTSFVNASLSISRLSKVVRIPFNFSRWIGRPMLAAGAAGAVTMLVMRGAALPDGWRAGVGIVLLALLYAAALYLLGIGRRTMRWTKRLRSQTQ